MYRLGASIFGYDLAVISYVLAAPNFNDTIKTKDLNYIGFITSSLLLGAFVGSVPASYVADIWSRRRARELLLPDPWILALCDAELSGSDGRCSHFPRRRYPPDSGTEQGDDDGRAILRRHGHWSACTWEIPHT